MASMSTKVCILDAWCFRLAFLGSFQALASNLRTNDSSTGKPSHLFADLIGRVSQQFFLDLVREK